MLHGRLLLLLHREQQGRPGGDATVIRMIRVPSASWAKRGMLASRRLTPMDTATTPRMTLLFRAAG